MAPQKQSEKTPTEYLMSFLEEMLNQNNVDHKDIKEEIQKLNKILIEPENGLYQRIIKLETFKSNFSKFFWIVLTGITTGAIGLCVKFLF